MKPKLIPAAALICLLAACNNSTDSDKKTDDTTVKVNLDDMHHDMTAATGNIPALPAVPAGAKVFFKNIKDGATISSPVKVEMGVEVVRVDTAGPVVAGSGHHHLFVDGVGIAPGEVIPKDSTHLHFGKGQTQTEVKLTPGTHTLTLQFADGLHRSYGPQLSSSVTVTVKK
jgi:hypothetical protein